MTAIEILKRIGPWELRPRGDAKHYGTILSTGECKIIIWKTAKDDYPDGDAAHSRREPEEVGSHWPSGGHYESMSDLDIAEKLLAELNS